MCERAKSCDVCGESCESRYWLDAGWVCRTCYVKLDEKGERRENADVS